VLPSLTEQKINMFLTEHSYCIVTICKVETTAVPPAFRAVSNLPARIAAVRLQSDSASLFTGRKRRKAISTINNAAVKRVILY